MDLTGRNRRTSKVKQLAFWLPVLLPSLAAARSSYYPDFHPSVAFDGKRVFAIDGLAVSTPTESTGGRLLTYDIARGVLEKSLHFGKPEQIPFRPLIFWKGHLYAGAQGALLRQEQSKWVRIPGLDIRTIYSLADGGDMLWIGSDRGVIGFDGKTIRKRFTKRRGLNSDHAYSIFETSGTLLVGTFRPLWTRYGDWAGSGLNLVDLKTDSISSVSVPVEDGIAYRVFRPAGAASLLIAVWQQWGVEGIYSFDLQSRQFGTNLGRSLWWSDVVLADAAGRLSRHDYWRFLKAYREATPDFSSWVPGGVRDFYRLELEEEPTAFRRDFEAAGGNDYETIAPLVERRDKLSLELLLSAAKRKDNRAVSALSTLAARHEKEAVAAVVAAVKDPSFAPGARIGIAMALTDAHGKGVVGVLQQVLDSEPAANDMLRKRFRELIDKHR